MMNSWRVKILNKILSVDYYDKAATLLLVFDLWVIMSLSFITDEYLISGLNKTFSLHAGSYGFIGIITAHFLHGNIMHFIGNSISFLFFGGMIAITRSYRTYCQLTLFIMVGSGLLMWFYVNLMHISVIGSSMLIFGYLGYLLTVGWVEKNDWSRTISIIFLISQGYMLFGLFPTAAHISWQGHIAGFVMGILAAFIWNDSKNVRNSVQVLNQ